MAVKAPEFIQEAETAWNSSTSPKTTATFSVKKGDWLVAFSMVENSDTELTISGGSLTWKEAAVDHSGTGNRGVLYSWTAEVDADKEMTVSVSRKTGTTSFWYGANVLTFRNSGGIGKTAVTNNGTSSGAPELSITTESENSAIVVANVDWNAVNGSKRKWREGAGSFTEQTFFSNSSHYVVYGGFHPSAGAAGAKTVGLSEPNGQRYVIGAIEVKGKEEGGGGELKTIEKSDSLSLSESLVRLPALLKADTTALSEKLVKGPNLPKADSLTLSEALTRRPGLAKSDTTSLSESLVRNVGHVATDNLTLSEARANRPALSKADSLSLSDEVLAKALKLIQLSDSVTLSEATTRNIGLLKAELVTLSDSLAKRISHIAADSIALSDALSKLAGLSRADALSLSEAIGDRAGLNKADSLILTDAALKAARKALADSLTLSESAEVEKPSGAPHITLEDVITLSDGLTRAVKIVRGDSLTLSDVAAKGAAKQLQDSITVSDSASKTPIKVLSDAVTLAESTVRAALKWIADALHISELVSLRIPGTRWEEDEQERWPADTDERWKANSSLRWRSGSNPRWPEDEQDNWD